MKINAHFGDGQGAKRPAGIRAFIASFCLDGGCCLGPLRLIGVALQRLLGENLSGGSWTDAGVSLTNFEAVPGEKKSQ